MDYQELIERLRYEGYDVSRNEAANAIESLLAENERLKEWGSENANTAKELLVGSVTVPLVVLQAASPL